MDAINIVEIIVISIIVFLRDYIFAVAFSDMWNVCSQENMKFEVFE